MVTIADMSTKELLSALRSVYHYDEDDEVIYVGKRLGAGGVELHFRASVQDIRNELNSRPHVPNQKEGKVLRRIRAQTGLSEEQIRAIPKYQEELMDACYPNRREMPLAQAKLVSRYYGRCFNRMFKVV